MLSPHAWVFTSASMTRPGALLGKHMLRINRGERVEYVLIHHPRAS